MQATPRVSRVAKIAARDESWAPFRVGELIAGEVHSLGFGGDSAVLESASLWRHRGGELPYARPVSSELFVVISGEARIDGDDGSCCEISAGDVVEVPAGFVGTWTTIEPIVKMSVSAANGPEQ